ncbi:MAG: DUF1178 family protein [Proteobacteria bacterium]|nr:DUF1178 family protein [Pseudomonadota bacterium]
MILYKLKCSDDHVFEAWFKDSTSFDRQAKRKVVECPVCGDTKVKKALMAPRLSKSSGKSGSKMERIHARVAEVEAAMSKLRKEVTENCEYVGDKFPDEARAIHYGDAEDRGIYGEATIEDAAALAEEDIKVFAVPGKRRKDA